MPRHRPQVSGYARIAQAEEEEDQPYSDTEHDPFQDPPTISSPSAEYAPIQPKRREAMRVPSFGSSGPRRPRRRRTHSGVDVKAINARLERWAEEIKERFKIKRIKGKSAQEELLEIHHSVFQAPEGLRPADRQSLESDYDDSEMRMSKMEFDDIVESVRTAIELGMHPTLISQGSSGSYFARNSGGKVVGVFKPKDEEPYASKNPKWYQTHEWNPMLSRTFTNPPTLLFVGRNGSTGICSPSSSAGLVLYLICHTCPRRRHTYWMYSYGRTSYLIQMWSP